MQKPKSSQPITPRRTSRAGNATGGFTLLEVIASTGILAVALVVVLNSISLSIRQASSTRRTAAAYELAAEKLHRTCAGEFLSLPVSGQNSSQGLPYRWRVEKQAADTEALDLLCCEVTWHSGGASRSIRLYRRVLAGDPWGTDG